MIIVVYFGTVILIAFATWLLPLPGKLIALAINLIIPEGVPFIDEIIQFLGIIKNLFRIVTRFFRN